MVELGDMVELGPGVTLQPGTADVPASNITAYHETNGVSPPISRPHLWYCTIWVWSPFPKPWGFNWRSAVDTFPASIFSVCRHLITEKILQQKCGPKRSRSCFVDFPYQIIIEDGFRLFFEAVARR